MSILKGPEGGYSSKRAVGLAYALLGIIMVLVGVFGDKATDFDILMIVVGTSLTSLGISSLPYFAEDVEKKRTVNPDPDKPPPRP